MKEGMPELKILIADREEHLRSALKLLLLNDHHNISITEAGNMDVLTQLTSTSKFDLVIIDWNFHRKGTRDIIANYRNLQSNIIVIVLSTRLEDKTTALEAGADAFVYKGDPPELLHNTLFTYLGKAAVGSRKSTATLPPCPRPVYCHYLV